MENSSNSNCPTETVVQQILESIISMDWFKGKSKPETIDCPIKYGMFRLNFSRENQSIDYINKNEKKMAGKEHGILPEESDQINKDQSIHPENSMKYWLVHRHSPTGLLKSPIYIYIHIYIYICMYIYIYTYIHTYIYIYILGSFSNPRTKN